jgi:hypothetical protein
MNILAGKGPRIEVFVWFAACGGVRSFGLEALAGDDKNGRGCLSLGVKAGVKTLAKYVTPALAGVHKVYNKNYDGSNHGFRPAPE